MRLLLVALLAGLAFAGPATAQIGIAARVGTLGPGLEISLPISPSLGIRATGSMLPYSTSQELTDLEVATRLDSDATIGAIGALVDFAPGNGPVRFSGGLLFNLFDVSSVGTPTESYFMDTKELLPSKLGTLSVGVSYPNQVQPIVGIGFGNLHRGKAFHVLFDLGAVYTGAPEIEMSGTGMIAATANWQDRLNEGISSFKWYPYVSLGFGFRL